jgi:hypothetical protein
MIDIATLSASWLIAKQAEADAIANRRSIEDQLAKLANVSADLDGTETLEAGQYTVKIVGRIDRKVDADKLQEIAIEHGLMDHLSSLFRWKPEINATAWKQADPAIVRPLADAITAKPGRPSFKITIKE